MVPNDQARHLPTDRPTVFVVDDDVSVRDALELAIRGAGLHVVVFESARAFLDRPRTTSASCLVLDVSLPDLSGLDLQQALRIDDADLPIVFLSGHGDVPMSVRAMKAGAVGFLTKPCREDELLEAVGEALERSRASIDGETALRDLRDRHASLTEREREVLALVVSGLSNKQVGSELGIAEITVKVHRGRVMRKMGAGSLPELVHLAARLDPERR